MNIEPSTTLRVHPYPESDTRFRTHVGGVASAVGGRPISDEAIIAAAAALLRATYPLATVELRSPRWAASGLPEWDAFRDTTSLDNELARRANQGDESAFNDLVERYQGLALMAATQMTDQPDAAADAVTRAFVATINDITEELPFRVRVAMAAHHAALESAYRGNFPTRAALASATVRLAIAYRLNRFDIAAILGVATAEVATLANEGLRASIVGGDVRISAARG